MIKSNAKRMEERLFKIASFSDEENMITRLTYSKSWVESIEWLTETMQNLDMTVRMDSFGNLIGNYNPSNSCDKPIGIGSHIDSVRNAGAYDGVAGIIIGLEIISMLKENNIIPKCPIEILATADEEGAICQKGYFGARYMTGMMDAKEAITYENINHKNILELREESGIFTNIEFGHDEAWAKNYYSKFYEVHVEQGNVLESMKKEVGIVKGVVGIGRIGFEFFGESDHAGPTLMLGRKDSLVASSEIITKLWDLAQQYNGKAVITVGRLNNSPNIHNVISSKTEFIVDYRSEDDKLSQILSEKIKKIASETALKYELEYKIVKDIYTPVKLFPEEIVNSIRALNMPNSMDLYSWAGHDAKAFAEITDTAMIFMPSIGGKSHSPKEFTDIKSFELVCDNIINLF